VVEPLADEFDLVDIALAAVATADQEARGAEDTAELAPATLPPPAGRGAQRGQWSPHGAGRRPLVRGEQSSGRSFRARPTVRQPSAIDGTADTGAAAPSAPRPPVARSSPSRHAAQLGPRGHPGTGWRSSDGRPVGRGPARGLPGSGVTRLFVGLGRAGGVRPGDLVGAITAEAGLSGREIGAIQIADGFSLVEVPDTEAERVIRAMRGATLRGQTVVVRRERY